MDSQPRTEEEGRGGALVATYTPVIGHRPASRTNWDFGQQTLRKKIKKFNRKKIDKVMTRSKMKKKKKKNVF